ncbi:hypothetical protein [Chroogloeocystis siderophila]|jgi:hypothetical protein|uniref:Non-ribosomal peptide synthase n=1 Tax=Chroogloeocystis siderophila 5.2 s.c.1 TaxID=247279 RepID=A0A1U7HZ50_9CHRO|nr:hypothetical protein [Chroogloeocystis siderophila]OKH28884.1 non-ribosomal peptide synthase [Chroogloeocystis siderophila 5.2 s.c.1]
MKVTELLHNLTQQGVQFHVNNDKLSIRSSKGVLSSETRAALVEHKAEIIALLRQQKVTTVCGLEHELSLSTIGRLISGCLQAVTDFKPPIINPNFMATKLTVTFKPLPKGYNNLQVIQFREALESKLIEYGVKVLPWQQATKVLRYKITVPILGWQKSFSSKVVKMGVDAVIDVERHYSYLRKFGIWVAEKGYEIYSLFVTRLSVSRIAKLSSWAEEHAAKYIEDPTNTQVIVLTKIDEELINPDLPYTRKIKVGLSTLVRTFSQIVLGVSEQNISILNMNLSDSIHSRKDINTFVLKSLVPKLFVPIFPLPLSKFEVGEYAPKSSIYATQLVKLGNKLASTELFPPGTQLSQILKRKSHRDIVNVIVNGRTGVSYGFVAYVEAPYYMGAREISANQWTNLYPVEGFNNDEVRQNEIGRRYIRIKVGDEYLYKQIPDIWLVSSRSGANKTNLNLETDVIRVGLKEKLYLQLPQGVTPETDIKPSYDIYVMLAIALAAALYVPQLIKLGAPIVHFHGYPAQAWLLPNEYCVGVNNPSVPCGTYESGVFNFLGISSLAQREDIALISLIEPDHGTNIIAADLDYLVARLQAGCSKKQIELGGKNFASLQEKWK